MWRRGSGGYAVPVGVHDAGAKRRYDRRSHSCAVPDRHDHRWRRRHARPRDRRWHQSDGPLWPFEWITGSLGSADIAFVNLESPLTDRGEPANKDFVFRGPPAGAQGLLGAGIDIVTMANNHVLDYGLTGLRDTWEALAAVGLPQVGSGENEAAARSAVLLERNGLRIAFLGYVNTPPDSVSGFVVEDTKATADRPGVAWLSPQAIAGDVAKAKGQADLVVVAFQAGVEYTETPIALQVESAHAAIDAGASVVFGHHPHVLQGIETYKGGVIIYSLGNLVFDFDFVDYLYPGLPNALTGMLRVELSKDGVVGCEFVPMIVSEADGRPRPVSGAEAAPVLERMRRLSDGSCGLG
jgi:poly-gamma-glutamate synthesis protein (capsule biosynthesis protein)